MAAQSSPYTPPVAEYGFLYREVFGGDVVARATGGALSADDAVDVLEAAGDFAAEVIAPLNAIGDAEGTVVVDGDARTAPGFKEAYAALVEAGWVAAEAPESAGGEGLPAVVQAGLGEIWNAANPALALCWMLTHGQIHALDAYAGDEVRETYLSRLVEGSWTGTMNLTEPQAGTDLGAIRTTATPNGDGSWSITGQKIFITWGDHDVAENIVHLVLARTPDAPAGAKGLSLFVAPKFLVEPDGSLGARNAVTTVSVEHKLGIHGSPTCVLAYDGATGYLVGEVGGGLAGMFVMMNSARLGMGHQGIGLAERAYQQASAYATARLQGPVPGRPDGTAIAEHPDVRRLLLSMSSSISAMRALAVYVGDLFDRADDADNRQLAEYFVPILKGWASEEAVRIASDGIQVHGGMGFIEETGAAQHYRDARIIPIYEGTTAIQSNDLVGRKTVRNQGETARRMFDLARAAVATLAGSDEPVARRTAERLERAVAAADRATAAVVGFGASPRDAHAVSVDYLWLLALVAGGWMHALIVAATLAHDGRDADDERRLTEADFFGAHQLAHAHALAESVAAGEIG
ncbi:MAG: acyl-CoA dehydrogenase [Microbacterium sp. SCN 71-21]|uniref:acyl-CoA dehydrogenase n=1 Tax=Microbacterium sp. SCN 71-21 TaxID=1660116 RepID=UPI000868B15D|nr:acyl-CoA dehydrogenase [Microbacterium sp. SCN 71-21]ODU76627.1 MAG: acyl-CoA dehydrogenase [Microbacterium sp. SCN 71-21]